MCMYMYISGMADSFSHQTPYSQPPKIILCMRVIKIFKAILKPHPKGYISSPVCPIIDDHYVRTDGLRLT